MNVEKVKSMAELAQSCQRFIKALSQHTVEDPKPFKLQFESPYALGRPPMCGVEYTLQLEIQQTHMLDDLLRVIRKWEQELQDGIINETKKGNT